MCYYKEMDKLLVCWLKAFSICKTNAFEVGRIEGKYNLWYHNDALEEEYFESKIHIHMLWNSVLALRKCVL